MVRLLRRVRPGLAFLWRALVRPAASAQARVLVVLEGQNDIAFLRRISAMLHRDDTSVPDLAELERERVLIFVSNGGGDLSPAFRFAALELPQLHILDRDIPPVTEVRQRLAAMVNALPKCHAVITSKRSLENYLESSAIREACGIQVQVTDEDNVSESVARCAYQAQPRDIPWDQLPLRARKRLRNKAKRWLNARAVEHMTPERLSARDPDGEVRSWLLTIASLVGG